MRTLTVTFHDESNYGASFQMVALHKTICSLGHENFVLDAVRHNKNCKRPTLLSNPKAYLRNKVISYYDLKRKTEMETLDNGFRNFKSNNISFTRFYNSMDDLRNDPPEVDCMITGSDQVWNMSTNPPLIPSRFLDFGKKDIIRFSFAASIENMHYSEEQKEYVKGVLASFKGISLREQSACDYINSFTGYSTIHIMDPIFLLRKKDWLHISKKARMSGPYILCYQVLRNREMQSVVNKLKKRTGLPTIAICNMSFRWINTDYSFFDVSPEEFLDLYNNATYIVTTSFHGTALGILFNKTTYTLCRSISSNRIKDLMNFVGLSDYVVEDGRDLSNSEIDWDKVNNELEKERIKSIHFLKKMLSD